MNPSELTMLISTLAVLISNEVTDDNELALWALAVTRLGNTLTAISAQRALIKKATPKSDSDASATADSPNKADASGSSSTTSCKAPNDNPQ